MITSVFAALLLAVESAPLPTVQTCPPALVAGLEQLYQWHQRREAGRPDFTPVARLFTSSLLSDLRRAYALEPGRDGRFVDFDLFSGTQVSTFGASIEGCRSLDARLMEVSVMVQVGLRGRPSEAPQHLLYRVQRNPSTSSAWRIDDITYPGSAPFHLRSFLQRLLQPASPGG